jgi:large subunit ribosomal protein L13
MKIINGENAVLGRIASYAAKESLKGEEIIILNCDKIIITGGRKNIVEGFQKKRGRVGSAQKGPKYSLSIINIVRRTIRGMLPEHRWGRGRDALKRIKCYIGIPKEFTEKKKIDFGEEKSGKFITIKEVGRV